MAFLKGYGFSHADSVGKSCASAEAVSDSAPTKVSKVPGLMRGDSMDPLEIDLNILKQAVNAVLDHLIEDVGVQRVAIDESEDFYWVVPSPEMYDTSKRPDALDAGRLSDDMHFVRGIKRGQGGDIAYNFVHVAPLLQYVGEKVKR